ncbi:MAG: amidohydrolase family protein [Chloroflexi bacterium]|nr:amidohydrolase family protein [Chloroflexota bacterium]
MLVDTDIHPGISRKRLLDFLPEPWRTRVVSGNSGPGHLGYWNPNGVNRADALTPDGITINSRPDTLSRYHFDEYAIDFGILNSGAIATGLSPEPDFAAAYCSAVNDVYINDWLPTDPRFKYSLVVSTADSALAAAEIHRCGDHPDVVQVLMASGAYYGYGHRFYHPIYEAAAAYDLPVAIHPGSEGSGVSGQPSVTGYPGSYFEWHTNLAGSYMAHLLSLVAEGTFQKFPTLKFVLIEGGVSWLVPIMWRFDKNWKALRMTVPWLDRPPSEIVYDHVYFTTQPIEEPENRGHLHQLLAMFPADKMLMFATDFPHWDGDTPDFSMRMLPKELLEPVMWRTAAALYKLPVPDRAP